MYIVTDIIFWDGELIRPELDVCMTREQAAMRAREIIIVIHRAFGEYIPRDDLVYYIHREGDVLQYAAEMLEDGIITNEPTDADVEAVRRAIENSTVTETINDIIHNVLESRLGAVAEEKAEDTTIPVPTPDRWFELFVDHGSGIGTCAIEQFDTEADALAAYEQHKANFPYDAVHVDEWELEPDGTPMPLNREDLP